MMAVAVADGPDRCRLRVRVTPRAAQDQVDGVQALADGQQVLALRVRAVPSDGAANRAVCALVARHLDVPPSAVAVERGGQARLKTLVVACAAKAVAGKLG